MRPGWDGERRKNGTEFEEMTGYYLGLCLSLGRERGEPSCHNALVGIVSHPYFKGSFHARQSVVSMRTFSFSPSQLRRTSSGGGVDKAREVGLEKTVNGHPRKLLSFSRLRESGDANDNPYRERAQKTAQ